MKKAFTLVETMLVLSIIGVIIALMIPALDRSKPDETTLKYRKAFFGIEEAVRNIVNDTKLYSDGDLTNPLNIPTGANAQQVFCQNIANTLNTIGKVDCRLSDLYKADENLTADKVNFRTTGGVSFGGLNNPFSADGTLTLCVDINGFNPDKDVATVNNLGCNPDDRAKTSRDQFRIRLNKHGKIYTGSSVGNNNWMIENMMLINPRVVTKEKTQMSAEMAAELIKKGIEGANANNKFCGKNYPGIPCQSEVDGKEPSGSDKAASGAGPKYCPSGYYCADSSCSQCLSNGSGGSDGGSGGDSSGGSSGSGSGPGVIPPPSPDVTIQ